MSAPTRTTCPYCGVGCGVLATADGGVAGDPDHPANAGRLCSKGAALGETLSLDGRLLSPKIGQHEATWDEALDLVAERFRATLAEHGPQAIGFYVSGQLLTEDYYVVNKLAKGFLGTANIDTNSRLCMASSVAGHRRAFGEDLVPGAYEDFDQADLIVLVGANSAWCHPILFRRMEAAREKRGTRLVVIDPRRTATAGSADLHLPIRPGTDVLLFNGLLAYLDSVNALDPNYIAQHTTGFDEALDAAKAEARYLRAVADDCGVAAADLGLFYQWFAETTKTVTAYSQGVNQSTAGADKVNAIINCHFATGRVGKSGMGPFSLTGQPNAMGGREVGGLANQLAAHMNFDDPDSVDRVRRFWQAPRMATRAGLTAVPMFDALAEGKIKALWIMGTNPAVSMPDAGKVRRALAACPFVVVSDCIEKTDTTAFAHVLLPAAAWGEKDGTVTNSERRISRQRAFRAPPRQARCDWEIVRDVAHRLGFVEHFAYRNGADVFREHAALSAFENGGDRLFDLGGLSEIDGEAYNALAPVQWPVWSKSASGTARLIEDGRCATPDRRGRFIAVSFRPPRYNTEPKRPLILNTGRLRDQWHTMTRTGLVPALLMHRPEPSVDLAPEDAKEYGIASGDLVRLTSDWGEALVIARVTPDQPKGGVFLPMHWTDQFTGDGIAGKLANPAIDLVSYQPELKHTPVSIEKIETGFEALFLTRRRFKPDNIFYWSRRPTEHCTLYKMRGPQCAADMTAALEALIKSREDRDVIEYRDPAQGVMRLASFGDQGLEDCLYLGPHGTLPEAEAMMSLFAQGPLDNHQRLALLGGVIDDAPASKGNIVCTCFQVGLDTIRAAIETQGIDNVRVLGNVLRAGTNCGSCIPELKEILKESRAPLAAE